MRFELAPPLDWKKPAEVRIRVGPLVPLPDDLQRWFHTTASADLPEGTTFRLNGMVAQTSGKGWPYFLVDAAVIRGGDVVERRIGAFYRFFEYGAACIVHIAGPDTDHQLSKRLMPLLDSGDPDWSDEAVCVSQLWS